jgi:hypothetical protein
MARDYTRELLEERWKIATMGLGEIREGPTTTRISPDLSRKWLRIERTLTQWTAKLNEGDVYEDQLENLSDLIGQLIEGPVKDALIAWVMEPGEYNLEATVKLVPRAIPDATTAEKAGAAA